MGMLHYKTSFFHHLCCSYLQMMKLSALLRSLRGHLTLCEIKGPRHSCSFQSDLVPRDLKSKPLKYKYPPFYDPYGPRPPPSDKIIQLAERIVALPPEEHTLIRHTLRDNLMHPKMLPISVEDVDLGPPGGAAVGSSKAEEKKVENRI